MPPADQPSYFASPPAVGDKGEANLTVESRFAAKTVGSGSLEVLATPMLAAIMEKAACSALEKSLAGGFTSVGVELSLRHEAASLLGAQVVAVAEVLEVQGREITFKIEAKDEAGPVGSCLHKRVVVDGAKFMGKAAKRFEGVKKAGG